MSAKSIIQSLEDSQLIRVFLDFVQTYGLQYQKIHKQISYKCYEATWILVVAKATGYGRSETEAYKNALKNLLELLMEDPMYVEFFVCVLPKGQYDKNAGGKGQMKTEGYQLTQKDNREKVYDSYSKIHYLVANPSIRNPAPQIKKQRQQVFHSKITLNKSTTTKHDQHELEQAKLRLRELEGRFDSVTSENKVLRDKLLNLEEQGQGKKMEKLEEKKIVVEINDKQMYQYPNGERYSHQKSDKKLILASEKLIIPTDKLLLTTQKYQQPDPMDKYQAISKISVPKLNLQVLPNYHKKSYKCLNEMLMATYNQNHGGSFQKKGVFVGQVA